MATNGAAPPNRTPQPLEELKRTGDLQLQAQGNTEAEMMMKYHWSRAPMEAVQTANKYLGYLRDGAITDPLETQAVLGAIQIASILLSAPCSLRERRQEEEERIQQRWAKVMRDNKEDDADVKGLLRDWSQADALIWKARTDSKRYGTAYAEQHYAQDYEEAIVNRRETERQAAKQLTPAAFSFFMSKLRDYQISRERAFAADMRYPTVDYSKLLKGMEAGLPIHDLYPLLPWPASVAFLRVQGSLLSGEEHRNSVISMVVGQHPMPSAGWGGPPPWWGPQGAMAPGQEADEEEDKQKKPLLSFGRKDKGRAGQDQQRRPGRRRQPRRG